MAYGSIYSSTWWGNTSSNWGNIYIALLSFLSESGLGGGSEPITYADIVAFNAQIVADGGSPIDVDALWAYVQNLPQSVEAENSVLAEADEVVTPYGLNGSDTYSLTNRLTWGRIDNNPDVYESSISEDGEYIGYVANGARYSNQYLDNGAYWYRSGGVSVSWNSTVGAWYINQSTGNAVLYPQTRYGVSYGFSMTYKLVSGEMFRNTNFVKFNLSTKTVADGASRVVAYQFTDLEDGWVRLDALYDWSVTSLINTWSGDAGTRADFYVKDFFLDTTGQVVSSDARPANSSSQAVMGRVQGVRTTNGNGYKAIVNEGRMTRKTGNYAFITANGQDSHFTDSHDVYRYSVGTTTSYKRVARTLSSYTANEYGRVSFYLKDNGVDDYVFAWGSKDGAKDWDYNGDDTITAIAYNWTTGVYGLEGTNHEDPNAEFHIEDWGNGWRRFTITSTRTDIAWANDFVIWGIGVQSQTGNGGSMDIGELMYEQSPTPFGHPSVWFRGQGQVRTKNAEQYNVSEMKSEETDFTIVFDAIGDLRLINGTDFEIDLSNDGLLKVNGVSATATDTKQYRNDAGESIVVIECQGGNWSVLVNNTEVMTLAGQSPVWDAGNLSLANKESHSGQYKGIFMYNRVLTSEEKADLIIE